MDNTFNVSKMVERKFAERIFLIDQKLAQSLKLRWSVKVFGWPLLPQRKYIFLTFIYIFWIVQGKYHNQNETRTSPQYGQRQDYYLIRFPLR